MRYKNIYLYILTSLLCVAVSSCFKDKGNYDYHEISEMKIDSFGRRTLMQYDTLKITPRLVITPDSSIVNDPSRFEYLWTAAITSRDPALGDSTLNILGTAKNLNIRLTLRPAKYVIYYKVTDRHTGNIYAMKDTLNIVTKYNEGWVILSDVNNVGRIDMVSFLPAPVTDTLLLTNVTKETALPVMNGPREIVFAPPSRGSYFYVTAADGGYKLEADAMYWQPAYNLKYECFFDYGATFSPNYVKNPGGSGSFLLNYGKNFYYYTQATMAGYGLPINRVAGENNDFEASPYLGNAYSNSQIVLFDKTNKRFVRWNDQAVNCAVIPEPNTAQGQVFYFNYKHQKDLLFMTTSHINNSTYAVMKDNDSVHVYNFTILSASTGQNFYRHITSTDIMQAERFAFNPEFGYLFYTVGSKVYEVSMDAPSVSKLVADFGSKKISAFKFHPFKSSTRYATQAKCLMIAVYDPALPAENCGSLYQYSVPGLFGNPVLLKSWSGFGKITSFTYRERS